MTESDDFEEWFYGEFLCSRDSASTIIRSESKSVQAKYDRVCKICKRMIENPDKSLQELREEIAVDFFLSMRIALDYINFCKLIVKRWKNRKV
jgi:hypothetical protein